MTSFSQLPLQQAIYTRLTTDSALSALITGLFDHVPESTLYPYIMFGDTTVSDWSTVTTIGTEQQLNLEIWSRQGGRAEALAIMQRIYQLLHQANFSVTGQTLVMLRFATSRLALETDGLTYHGVMQFHALLQAN